MEEIDIDKLNDIPLPQGLESRLSARIDVWAATERAERDKMEARRAIRPRRWSVGRVSGIAAAAAIVAVCFWHWLRPVSTGPVDTYDDPQLAYLETVSALTLLSDNLSLCKAKVDEVGEINEQTDSIISSTLNLILK